MSTIYNNEPPTKGKVVLHTTLGDIEIELWPKEAPKAVRNFCQLCMEGYYDDTVFHRIIAEFLIQGGDPTGTGRGGESIYARPFKNEFHSRLKFNHRGLVACATDVNQAQSNSSQFFITLERCDHLDRVNTIFGRVAGDTIFNVVRISEQPVDDADRPIDPPRIVSSSIILPPFDDIQPRTTPAEKAALAVQRAKKAAHEEFLKRKKHGKKTALLSIGDEVDEDEEEIGGSNVVRFRSAHETGADDSRLEHVAPGAHDAHILDLRQQLAFEQKQRAAENAEAQVAEASEVFSKGSAADKSSEQFEADMMRRMQKRKAASGFVQPEPRDAGPSKGVHASHDSKSGSDEDDGDGRKAKKHKKLSMSKAGKGAASKRAAVKQVPDAELLTAHEKAVAQIRQRKRIRGTQDKSTMERLKQFSKRLDSWEARPAATDRVEVAASALSGKDSVTNGEAADADKGAYDGKVNKSIDHSAYLPAAWRVDSYIDASDDEDFSDLQHHKMQWNANDQVADANKRRDDVDDYMVVDPLLEKGKEKFNKKNQAAKKRLNDWAGRVQNS